MKSSDDFGHKTRVGLDRCHAEPFAIENLGSRERFRN